MGGVGKRCALPSASYSYSTTSARSDMPSPGRRRKEVLNAVPKVADALVTSVNSSVAEIFANQRLIEAKVGQLRGQSQKFTDQSQQWLSVVDSFNNSVKQLGDFEMYAGTVEGDMRMVAKTIELITQPPPPRGSAPSPPSRASSVPSPGAGARAGASLRTGKTHAV